MTTVAPERSGPVPPRPWWFPASYALHAAEEYWGGETFPVWISRLLGVHFTAAGFLWLNGIAMVAMLGAAASLAAGRGRWLLVALGTVVAVNGTAHTIASLATGSYSPGVVTGLVLWLPLGVLALRAGHRALPPRAFWPGVAAGVAAHAVVSGIVLLGC